MTPHHFWSRRTFLQRIGFVSALGVVGSRADWSFSGEQAAGRKAKPIFAYVGSWEQGIQVFAIQGRNWKLTQTIASDKPSALSSHPTQRFLYAVNEIEEYRGLPTSTVEAYSIDPRDGQLSLLNRQPLSLSATGARHLAVSPDGSNLVVAVHGGGSYNMLPLRADGLLGRVSGILKEVGAGPDPERQNAAHPQRLLFDTTGRHLLTADLGCDRINVLTPEEGRLIVADRRATESGSGPRSLAFHPSGRVLYVMNELNASISSFAYDAANGRILQRLQHQPLRTVVPSKGAVSSVIAMHSSGKFLYTSYSCCRAGTSVDSSIAAWRIDRTSGRIEPIQQSEKWMRSSHIESMVPTHNGLFVLSHPEGVFRLQLDPLSGSLQHAVRLAKVAAPKTLVLRYV